jgi:kynurenine formamidase
MEPTTTSPLALLASLAAGARVVDLSATIAPSPEGTPAWQRTDIEYRDHQDGAAELEENFGAPRHLLRLGEGPATEFLTRLGTHNSTHVDAPRHYNSVIEGRPARAIDELPLDWFVGPAVVIDATGREDGQLVDVEDLERALAAIGHELASGDIVLIRTGCDAHYGSPDYAAYGPGVSPAATLWLHGRGVRVMGIDAWSWDPPLRFQVPVAVEHDRTGVIWGAHQVDREYAQVERMVNLGAVPATGALVVVLPLKVQGGSAGPTRAVALVPEPAAG